MKWLIIVIVLITNYAMTQEKPGRLSDVFPIGEATGFVFVNEVRVGGLFTDENIPNGEYSLVPKGLRGAIDGELAQYLTTEAPELPTTDADYPFIGILARVLLLSQDGRPLCAMQVVNWNRTVVFYGVTERGGKYFVEDKHAIVKSDFISRWVYQQVKSHFPDEFNRSQEMYSKSGHSIESLLFPDTNSGKSPE